MALETEVPRLDDTGVNGTDRHLVDLLAFDAEEVGASPIGGEASRPGQAPVIAGWNLHRFEPGMSLGHHVPLLRDLPLEQVCRRALRRQDGQPFPTRVEAARSVPSR